MLLAAVALGYEGCGYKGYNRFDMIGKKMADALGVPESYSLICYLPIGAADENASERLKSRFPTARV